MSTTPSITRRGDGTSGFHHDQAMQLLPWYVNGSLPPQEHEQVAAHLLHCAACRHESRWLGGLQAAIVESDVDPAMQLRLQRVWDKIEHADAPWPVKAWRGLVRRLTRLLPRQQQRPQAKRRATWLWQLGGPGVIVLAGLYATVQWHEAGLQSYRTLSSSPPASGTPGITGEAQIVVIFAKGTSAQAMQTLLRQAGARILDGPNPEGAYVVSVEATRKDQVLRQWQHSHEVRFAQPAQGTALERR